MRVGLIGCGDISGIYLENARRFADIRITACASHSGASAARTAARYGLRAMEVSGLLADPDIDIILNLTPADSHAQISLAALAAGKHVYTEKPLGISRDEGRRILETADRHGLRVGAAPDTVLGPGVQTARAMIDRGDIGPVIFGSAAVLSRGMEHWHPSPAGFYRRGGGPVLDIGPYFLATLVTLLGPVAAVSASARTGPAQRIVTTPGSPNRGRVIIPEVPTTVIAQLDFTAGASVSFIASWDAGKSDQPSVELHGTDGSLSLPHFNWFGGDILRAAPGGDWQAYPTADLPFGKPEWPSKAGPVANYRGLGLAEMARAISEGRPHRADGAMALHLLDVMLSILESAEHGTRQHITSTCTRPAALSATEAAGLLAK